MLSNEVFVKALVSSGRTVSIFKFMFRFGLRFHNDSSNSVRTLILLLCQCILVSEEDEEATFVNPANRGK